MPTRVRSLCWATNGRWATTANRASDSLLFPSDSLLFRSRRHNGARRLSATRYAHDMPPDLADAIIIQIRLETRWRGFVLPNAPPTSVNGYTYGTGRCSSPPLPWMIDAR